MATINPFQGPINYAIDVQSPFDAALGGFKVGQAGAEMQARREAQQAAQQAQTELKTLFTNPNATAADYARATAFLPKDQAESVRKSFDMLNAEQQQNSLRNAAQVYSAVKSGQIDIAKNLLKEQAAAQRNAGREQEAKASEHSLQLIELNPTGAQTIIGLMTASLPGGKELLENVDKTLSTGREEAMFPSKLVEAQSNAQKAAVAAKFAESNAALDLQKKGWDITKLQEDIKINKLNSQIAAMNAATAKETNALRRDELKLQIQDKREKLDSAIREKAAEVESARADMDNFLNTTERILKTPKGVIKAAAGPIDARIPTMQSDVADFEALVETLGSQAFMAQIPKMKGTGALSEGEGKKLQSSLQNLSLSQSPEQLLANVKEAQRLILKGRSLLSKKAGIPDTVPDTPAAAPTGNDIDALLKKYGGK